MDRETGSEEQEGAEAEDDPDAEHIMVQGVVDSLLEDDADEDVPPQVNPISPAWISVVEHACQDCLSIELSPYNSQSAVLKQSHLWPFCMSCREESEQSRP